MGPRSSSIVVLSCRSSSRRLQWFAVGNLDLAYSEMFTAEMRQDDVLFHFGVCLKITNEASTLIGSLLMVLEEMFKGLCAFIACKAVLPLLHEGRHAIMP